MAPKRRRETSYPSTLHDTRSRDSRPRVSPNNNTENTSNAIAWLVLLLLVAGVLAICVSFLVQHYHTRPKK